MKTLLFTLLIFASTMLSAQNPIEIKLWNGQMPNSNDMTRQIENGPIYISELTYAVLTYRMPNGHHNVPLSDALQAMRIMKQHADEWHIQKIGIMGSSAGGHLASTLATHYTDKTTRPDFQILFYPVITMDPTYSHLGSHDNLLGENPSKTLEEKYSNEKQVTEQTPPAFILHSSDDTVVPVANSINYYLALNKHNVSACLHIYPIGGHGWGYNENFTYKREWTGELEKWLREINK